MRGLSVLSAAGVFAFILILLNEVMAHPMWGEIGESPTTVDFATTLFNDWAIATLVL